MADHESASGDCFAASGQTFALKGASLCPTRDAAASLVALATLAIAAAMVMMSEVRSPTSARAGVVGQSSAATARSLGAEADYRLGGYGGITYTHPSDVTIERPGGTKLTVHDNGWDGRPFKSPIYYGARVLALSTAAPWGGMLDFTHAKAISRPAETRRFSGTRDGQPLSATAKVGDVFHHLEFSHGHNMLTLNGLWRFPTLGLNLRPYVGAGAGVSLPHTEVMFRGDKLTRTYEYQYTGPVAQVLLGLEVPLGRLSWFIEYKFSFAGYTVPLHARNGGWLAGDLWRQFRRWWSGAEPVGGWLWTRLATHHAISGVTIRIGRAPAAAP